MDEDEDSMYEYSLLHITKSIYDLTKRLKVSVNFELICDVALALGLVLRYLNVKLVNNVDTLPSPFAPNCRTPTAGER